MSNRVSEGATSSGGPRRAPTPAVSRAHLRNGSDSPRRPREPCLPSPTWHRRRIVRVANELLICRALISLSSPTPAAPKTGEPSVRVFQGTDDASLLTGGMGARVFRGRGGRSAGPTSDGQLPRGTGSMPAVAGELRETFSGGEVRLWGRSAEGCLSASPGLGRSVRKSSRRGFAQGQ